MIEFGGISTGTDLAEFQLSQCSWIRSNFDRDRLSIRPTWSNFNRGKLRRILAKFGRLLVKANSTEYGLISVGANLVEFGRILPNVCWSQCSRIRPKFGPRPTWPNFSSDQLDWIWL